MELGGFDQAYDPAYFEDVDLCLRLRAAGWTIVYEPSAVVVHHRSMSTREDLVWRRPRTVAGGLFRALGATSPERREVGRPTSRADAVTPGYGLRPLDLSEQVAASRDVGALDGKRQREFRDWIGNRLSHASARVEEEESRCKSSTGTRAVAFNVRAATDSCSCRATRTDVPADRAFARAPGASCASLATQPPTCTPHGGGFACTQALSLGRSADVVGSRPVRSLRGLAPKEGSGHSLPAGSRGTLTLRGRTAGHDRSELRQELIADIPELDTLLGRWEVQFAEAQGLRGAARKCKALAEIQSPRRRAPADSSGSLGISAVA